MQLTNNQKRILEGKICPYCQGSTEYIDSSIAFGQSFGMIYFCGPCWSWCGVHPGTNVSLGRIANTELRYLKQQAHEHFDKIWKEKLMKRKNAYYWLSAELKIPRDYTHIGFLNIENCKRVIHLSKEFYNDKKNRKRRNASNN